MPGENVIGRMKAPALVVSSNKFTAQLARTLLFGMGIGDILFANTAEDALARMTVMTFDLIIADSGPTTFDPLKAIAAMRALKDRHQAETPVVLLIASVEPEFLSDVKKAQIEFAVTKPVVASVFADRVQRALQKRLGAPPPLRASQPTTKRLKSRYTILILSGNRWTGQLIRNVLLGIGRYDIMIAEDTGEAKRRLAADPVDIVMADTGATTYDSLSVIKSLRGLPDQKLANLPVIMIAPEGQAKTVPPAELAIEFVISKPLHSGSLCEAIDNAAGRSDELRTRRENQEFQPPPPDTNATEDTTWMV